MQQSKSYESSATTTSDEGLKSYTRKVFNYMMISLGITGVVSYLMLRTGLISLFLSSGANGVGYSLLGMIIMWAPLIVVLFMTFNKNMSIQALKISLFSIAILYGISLSLIVLPYGVHNAFQAFFLTGVIFGSMSIYGYTTGRDLLKMGSFLVMALFGLVVVSIFSLFTGGVGIWFSYAAVLIFTGLVAFEVQQIKSIYYMTGGQGKVADRLAIFSALNLYLDFINIFIHLLRIMGNRN